jgi:spermidine synthase
VTPDSSVCVEQQDGLITLHFDNGLIQTQINKSHPEQLPLLGNRMMLIHLLFGIEPQSVLLAGSGGGSLGLWFNQHLPATEGLAVEISSKVISLAEQHFGFPPANSNWRIEQADIREFLSISKRRFDFILFDIEEQGKTPEWLTDDKSLKNCLNCLTDQGVASFNIVADSTENFMKALWSIRQTFPDRTCCLSNPESGNLIVTAFNQKPSIENLAEQAEAAKKRFNIEFDVFYRQLIKDNPPQSGIF